jgi:resuscitation-promoting factor RpfB
MASAGSDWRSNPITQIRWGIGYIAGKYGSPCTALSHSNSYGYY